MQPTKHVLQTHAAVWLARGAIALTALLNFALVNKLTFGPYWLEPVFELAMLVPLSVATAWTQIQVRNATTGHHWGAFERNRRLIRVAVR